MTRQVDLGKKMKQDEFD